MSQQTPRPLLPRPLPPWALALLQRQAARQPGPMDFLWQHPERVMQAAKLDPDPWQSQLLRSTSNRVQIVASRQCGKSQTTAAVALLKALREPPALVLLLSPSLRQSGELFREKVLTLWRALGSPFKDRPPTQLELKLSNGSRIVSLPADPNTIVGISAVNLIVVDEASRVADALYKAVRPMLAVTNGRLIALSTPYGQQGWFYKEWDKPSEQWERVLITADKCPRITPEFLAAERKSLGESWYLQEYWCEFSEMVGSVFSGLDIKAAFDAGAEWEAMEA